MDNRALNHHRTHKGRIWRCTAALLAAGCLLTLPAYAEGESSSDLSDGTSSSSAQTEGDSRYPYLKRLQNREETISQEPVLLYDMMDVPGGGMSGAYASLGTGWSSIPKWKEYNSHTVGWLKVPGTNINYPVIQHPSDNNAFLSIGYDMNYSYNGVIWADYEDKIGDRTQLSENTVIYGHNWTNYSATPAIARSSDVMFAQLTSFHHLDFAQNNQFVYFSTEEEQMVWQIFAAFYTGSDNDFYYISCNMDAGSLQYIIDEARSRSEHNYDVEVSSSDKILTLSTCTRRFPALGKNQKFVVMAKLIDSAPVEAEVTANPNPKRPSL